jgi:hypothetical protein
MKDEKTIKRRKRRNEKMNEMKRAKGPFDELNTSKIHTLLHNERIKCHVERRY